LDDTAHEFAVGDLVAEREPDIALFDATAGGEVEGERDGVLGFVEVGDVEYEGGRSAGVDEAEAWAGADTHDRRMAHGVQAAVAGGEQPVDVVAGFEWLAGFVDPPVPPHPGTRVECSR
jgi:hypothetical protein